MRLLFLSLQSNNVKSLSGAQSDHSLSSASESSSESLYSTAMRRERMVATSHPTSSLLFCSSCCSWTFFNWIPVEDKCGLCCPLSFKSQTKKKKKREQTYADGRQQVASGISCRLRLSSAAVVPCYRRGSSCGRERWRWGTWGRWDRWQGVSGA